MFLNTIHTVLFIGLSILSFSGNPYIRGTWKGFMLSKSMDADNKDGMPVILTIVDDNDKGNIVGEMIVKYRYQTDIYKAKYTISGNIDYINYRISLNQEKFVYSDLLPKGLNWCIGNGTLSIFRSNYKKYLYMDGYMQTGCGTEQLRLVLVKQ